MTGIQANEGKLYLCAIKDLWPNQTRHLDVQQPRWLGVRWWRLSWVAFVWLSLGP